MTLTLFSAAHLWVIRWMAIHVFIKKQKKLTYKSSVYLLNKSRKHFEFKLLDNGEMLHVSGIWYGPVSVCLSVCLSVTSRCSIKMTEHIHSQITSHDSTGTLDRVFEFCTKVYIDHNEVSRKRCKTETLLLQTTNRKWWYMAYRNDHFWWLWVTFKVAYLL